MTLTWSWSFDVTAGIGMANKLLENAAAHALLGAGGAVGVVQVVGKAREIVLD